MTPSILRASTLLLTGMALALGAAFPRAAEACSCAFDETQMLAPADGETDAPTNARVWVGAGLFWGSRGSSAERVSLLDGAGAPVDAVATEMAGYIDLVVVLTPAAPLISGETYSIQVDEDEVLGTFTVGGDSDTDAPAIPAELDRESSSSARHPNMMSSCGPTDVVSLELEPTGLIYVANIEGVDGLDPDGLTGEASELSATPELYIGSAGCTWSWPDAEPHASTTVRWGAFDIAGNFSGWSEPSDVTIPAAGCSCTLEGGAPPAAGAAAAVLALAALGLRRRR